jgi:diguanylate cyclase (GGDEF)-like protein/putative nucleotidyltransferase with HDIG domain
VAVRAERRMQAAQMAILAVLALVVLAVAAITGRGMVDGLERYRGEQAVQSRLDSLRYALQEEEAALWRRRADGNTSIPLEVAANILAANGEAIALSEIEADGEGSAAEGRAIADTLAGLTRVVGLVATSPGSPELGSPADLRFVATLTPLIADLRAAADTWARENSAQLDEANRAVTAATRRIITLTGATAILAILLGLLVWRLVARSRRRIVDALQGATERLRHLADTDPLTGLSNQRLLHDRLQEASASAQATGRGLSAVMIDLDHFKTVNDTYGHPVGDLVLVETARRIRDAARSGDIVARIGGEEFLMLLPDTDGVTALAVAERVRAAVRATDYPAGAGRLTASLGVASLADELDADGLLAQADAALYWAKRHGRDAAFRYNAGLMGDLSVSNRVREIAREDGLAALRALARAIDARDAATQRHSIRVADMAVMIATALGWTSDQAIRLREAGLVHDVGKIGIPDSILLKSSGLTPDERELMKDHARLGARIVSEVLDPDQVEWVAHHHERWDGDGYPLGIDGTDIPEGARILAVADSWDAMTSAREYNVAMTREEALEECVRCSGSHFWPIAIDALVRLDVAGALPETEAAELTAA